MMMMARSSRRKSRISDAASTPDLACIGQENNDQARTNRSIRGCRCRWRSLIPPGPAGSHLWSIRRALKDPLTFLLGLTSYGDVVTLRPDKTFLINSPDDIKRVLQDNHFNDRKGERYIRALERLFGRGLLISEGDLWLTQRRAIQPAFYRAHHPDYAHAIVVTTRDWLGRLADAARAGTPLDLRKHLVDLTLAVLMKTRHL
jgi:cytochrome P450